MDAEQRDVLEELERLRDRFAKLVRLAKSPNSHEAERAAQKAKEMMLTHGGDLFPPTPPKEDDFDVFGYHREREEEEMTEEWYRTGIRKWGSPEAKRELRERRKVEIAQQRRWARMTNDQLRAEGIGMNPSGQFYQLTPEERAKSKKERENQERQEAERKARRESPEWKAKWEADRKRWEEERERKKEAEEARDRALWEAERDRRNGVVTDSPKKKAGGRP